MKKGKTVVVTGATAGIGAAVVQAFVATGARLFLVGRNPRKLASAARRIPAEQLAGIGVADLGAVDAVDGLVREIGAQRRSIDVLVHAAGQYGWTELGAADLATFELLYHTNVRAAYLLTQGLVPLLERSPSGQIVFINSSITRGFGQGVAAFKATQHALQGLTDSLRQDLNTRGIRVSSLYPGQTATPRMRRIYAHRAQPYEPKRLLQPKHVAEAVVTLTQLPAPMEVTDVYVRASHPY